VALDPTIGSEISKIRPAVIVSNNSCNTFGTRVVVLSLTSNVDSAYPGEALVVINGKPARVLGDQIRSLAKITLALQTSRHIIRRVRSGHIGLALS
jgi:mRNA interferase MazF